MNDREKEVFRIIVTHYLNNGESVGSRTLEKKYNIGVSSATIRNVMSDLETMGLITKTHTSSGRIPTIEGYRRYIEDVVPSSDLEDEIKDKIFMSYQKRINETDQIFKETVEMLSNISETMAIAIEPSSDLEIVKKVQFIKITDTNIYVVVVLKNNIIKTSVLTVNTYMSEDNIENLNQYMKNLLETTHKTFTLRELEIFLNNIGNSDLEIDKRYTFGDNKVFVDGMDYLLKDDIEFDKLLEVMKTINNKNEVKDIFKKLAKSVEYDVNETNVVFGEDIGLSKFEGYSFIFRCYEFGDDKGILGLITPTRVDYAKLIGIIDYVVVMLKKVLNQNMNNKFLEFK